MLDIAYGHTATSMDDELIMLADTVVREAMDTGSLAGTLVDFFPAREYSRIARAETALDDPSSISAVHPKPVSGWRFQATGGVDSWYDARNV